MGMNPIFSTESRQVLNIHLTMKIMQIRLERKTSYFIPAFAVVMKYLRTGRLNSNLDGVQYEEVLAEADDLGVQEMVDDLKKRAFVILNG